MLLIVLEVMLMIYVDLNGRCGDQFFQYAFARKIQIHLKNKEPLQLNFYNQERWKNTIHDDSFRDDLSRFSIVEHNSFVSDTQNIFRFGKKRQRRLLKNYFFIRKIANRILFFRWIARKCHRILQRNGIYYEDTHFSFFGFPKNNVDIFIRGYFEDYHFYEDVNVRAAMLNELKPIVTTNPNPLMNKIKNCNSVCVSMRSWKEVSQFSNVFKSRFICDKNYFKDAMNKMKNLIPDCEFFIFSDDLDFAQSNVDDSFSPIFENSGNTIEQKIELMSSCKHFILSNSSFSWWVQYLSDNTNSIIISPSRWYTDKNDIRVINDNWIRIDS